MRLSRWKKFAPHLIIMATIIAIAVPTLGSHALNELNPYLALSEELAKPEAIVADHMEIVDRTYVNDDPSKGWETVTWAFKLEITNRGDEDIILPAANVTLYYLDDILGKGYISEKHEIAAGKSKMIDLYMVMENNRISKTWFTGLILGNPLDLTAIFEPYILVDGPDEEPFLPLSMVQELEFSFPHTSRGPAPFIHSIIRSPVSVNHPVSVSVSATDEGTGISNRTYIYYSIDDGISWDKSLLIGGEWSNKYKFHLDENGIPVGLLGGYYPIRSTLQEETYEGEIPGFPSGTSVLFKVYLEDYAGNYEHEKTANWVESQTYSYIVPSAGEVPKFTAEFKETIEPSSTEKFFDYLELNGINLQNYLYLNDVNSWTILPKLADISKFFYEHDIDASYCLGILNIDFDKGAEIMADSGISSGYMLKLFGVSIDDFFDFVVEHIFLPTKHDLAKQASDIFRGISIIDDIEGYYPWSTETPWTSNVSKHDDELEFILRKYINIGKDRVGVYKLRWNTTGPATLGRDFSSNPIDLSNRNFLTFYLDYPVADYQKLNGNLSVILTDNNGRTMTSNRIVFENDGSTISPTVPLQQITLELNSRHFTIDQGFNFGAIHKMNFTYSGTLKVKMFFDYISAYSSRAYVVHQSLTYDFELTHKEINNFLFGIWTGELLLPGIFWGTNANLNNILFKPDYLVTDFSIDSRRTGGWNFLHLMATDNGTLTSETDELGEFGQLNQHMTAANLILSDRNITIVEVGAGSSWYLVLGECAAINFFERLCTLVGTEIVKFDEEPLNKEEIYPYTQNVATLMVYIPLGAVAALAIILRVREHRYKTKAKKIRTKYKKIGK
ncbi:MAG: hypothetical protein ACFFAH_09785 [Promethearchaeota archaeon]